MVRQLRVFGVYFLMVWLISACVTEKYDPAGNKVEVDRKKVLRAYLGAGAGYYRNGNSQGARRHFVKALNIDSDSPEALNGMALVYRLQGDTDEEEKYYKRALRADKGYSTARFNYATLLYHEERYDEAIEHLVHVTKDYSYTGRAQGFEHMGYCYLKLGKIERAEKAFKRALKLDNTRLRSYLELAEIYFSGEHYSEAYKYFSHYKTQTQLGPEGLWLGIRLERIMGDMDALASYELRLKKLIGTPEYIAYKASVNQGSPDQREAGQKSAL